MVRIIFVSPHWLIDWFLLNNFIVNVRTRTLMLLWQSTVHHHHRQTLIGGNKWHCIPQSAIWRLSLTVSYLAWLGLTDCNKLESKGGQRPQNSGCGLECLCWWWRGGGGTVPAAWWWWPLLTLPPLSSPPCCSRGGERWGPRAWGWRRSWTGSPGRWALG